MNGQLTKSVPTSVRSPSISSRNFAHASLQLLTVRRHLNRPIEIAAADFFASLVFPLTVPRDDFSPNRVVHANDYFIAMTIQKKLKKQNNKKIKINKIKTQTIYAPRSGRWIPSRDFREDTRERRWWFVDLEPERGSGVSIPGNDRPPRPWKPLGSLGSRSVPVIVDDLFPSGLRSLGVPGDVSAFGERTPQRSASGRNRSSRRN